MMKAMREGITRNRRRRRQEDTRKRWKEREGEDERWKKGRRGARGDGRKENRREVDRIEGRRDMQDGMKRKEKMAEGRSEYEEEKIQGK